MSQYENNAYFWQKVDSLILSGDIEIEYHKGDCHKDLHHVIYPVDYGYLKMIKDNGHIIKCYKGTNGNECKAAIVSANLLLKDVSVKLLIGTTEEEERNIQTFLNEMEFQKTVLIRRDNTIPDWLMD